FSGSAKPSEPPAPKWPNVAWPGPMGRSGWVSWKPRPKRDGRCSTRSWPYTCSAVASVRAAGSTMAVRLIRAAETRAAPAGVPWGVGAGDAAGGAVRVGGRGLGGSPPGCVDHAGTGQAARVEVGVVLHQ